MTESQVTSAPGEYPRPRGRWPARILSALVASFLVLILGADYGAATDYVGPNHAGYSLSGYTLNVQDPLPSGSLTLTAPVRPTVSGSNQSLTFMLKCVSGSSVAYSWGAAWNAAYYNATTSSGVDPGTCASGYQTKAIYIVNLTRLNASGLTNGGSNDAAIGRWDTVAATGYVLWGYPFSDAGTAVCSQGTLSLVQVWYDGSDFGYLFKWTGTDNFARWYLHKTGDLAYKYGISGYVKEVPGQTFFYMQDNDPGLPTGMVAGDQWKLRLFTAGGDPTNCWVSATVATAATDPGFGGSGGGPDDYGDGDDGEGNDCSAFDVFCRIKGALSWAFMPSEDSLDQWSDLGSDIEGKVPFVYVVGSIDLADSFFPSCSMPCTEMGSYNGLFTIPEFTINTMGDEFTTGDVVVLPASSDQVEWLRDYRELFSVVMWVLLLAPFAYWIWTRLFPAVGSSQ